MLILDYSQVAIASISPFFDDLSKDANDAENICRHSILSKIKTIRSKFREYGEVVIACDGNDYWRKDIYPYYKAHRKEAKEASSVPWAEIYRVIDMVREELTLNSPYRVIHYAKAEADDIFGVLVKLCNSRVVEVGLEMDSEPVLMVTSDGDMKQLLTNSNVKQYSPMQDKFVTLDVSAKEFLRRKILTGDRGDGIPGVFSPINSFAIGKRQSACTEKRMLPILESEDLISGAPDDEIRNRIIQNRELISFEYIPQFVESRILELYNIKPKGNKMSLYKYLSDKKCSLLMEDIDKF